MKWLTVFSLLSLLILTAAVPVYADKPVPGSEEWDLYFPVCDCADYGYDFEVWDNVVSHASWTDHYDEAGNWIWVNWHNKGMDHIFNSNNPNRFVEGHFSYSVDRRPAPGEEGWVIDRLSGVFWNIQLPGEGPVCHESGLLERYGIPEDQLVVLKRVGLAETDFETLCRYLAE